MDSRQRILEYLKRAGEASVAELSRALQLTPVTIRHHLEALQAERLLKPPQARRKTGPGRPEMVYRLSPVADQSMPRNYAELCARLLDQVQRKAGLRSSARMLGDMGEHQGGQAELHGEPGSGRRRASVQEYLERRGYFPSVGRQAGPVTLTLANCPYLEAARETPELCQYDLELLRALFGQPVRMARRIVQQAPVCTFTIGEAR